MSENLDLVVFQVLADLVSPPTAAITPDSHLEDDLGFDELAFVELVIALEKRLDIEISDEDSMTWERVRDALDYLQSRQSR